MLVRIVNRNTLIRLLLQKQFDLGLRCLYRHFWQATTVQNCRTFTIVYCWLLKHLFLESFFVDKLVYI